jgi:hypothetical protein
MADFTEMMHSERCEQWKQEKFIACNHQGVSLLGAAGTQIGGAARVSQDGIFLLDDLWSTWIIRKEKEAWLLKAVGFVVWSH